MKHQLDNLIGFLSGMSGFLFDITFLQTGIWWFDIIKAGCMAFLCGFLGVAGKQVFTTVMRKIYKRRNDKRP